MSKLSTSYASYMTHFHKFEPRINTFHTAFQHIISLIVDGKFIDCGLENELHKYPRYPTLYNFFNTASIFDMWKIQNVTLDSVELLANYISNTDVLVLKRNMDEIPEEITKIINDIYLQYSFMTDINDIFHKKQHFHDFSKLKTRDNYFNSLSENPYNTNFTNSESSFLHTFVFDFLFRQLLKNTSNISSSLHVYAIDTNIFNNDVLKNTFKAIMDRLKIGFCNKTSTIILQSLYRMNKIDETLIEKVSKIIQDEMSNLYTAFDTHIDQTSPNQIGKLFNYFLNSLYLVSSSKLISDLSTDSTIFNQDFIRTLATTEDEKFDSFMKNKSVSNIKNYLYASYFYKFWPIKYINVLPLIMSEYTEQVIKPDDSFAFSQNEVESLYQFCISDSNLNYENLLNYFNTNVNSDYLLQLLEDEKVYDFTYFLYLIELFDNFMESEYYEEFVKNIYNKVFIKLRDDGYIHNEFNWCKCFTLFNLFFKTFFRYQISSGNQFIGLVDSFKNHIVSVLSNSTGDDKYEFKINYNESKIRSLFRNVINSNIEKMHMFSENMYTSSLTNEITSDMLAYFLRN